MDEAARSITPDWRAEQAGFFQDEFAHGGEIVERTRVALRAEEFAASGKTLSAGRPG